MSKAFKWLRQLFVSVLVLVLRVGVLPALLRPKLPSPTFQTPAEPRLKSSGDKDHQ